MNEDRERCSSVGRRHFILVGKVFDEHTFQEILSVCYDLIDSEYFDEGDQIILDSSNTCDIDHVGLATLIRIEDYAFMTKNGSIGVIPSDDVRKKFRVVGLIDYFRVYQDREQALASVR